MDLSDIDRAPCAHGPAASDAEGVQRWRELVGQIGAEIAGPLTTALERLDALRRSGRIDRHNLRLLHDDIERARRVSMESQQLARIASGRVRQASERLQLTQIMQALLAERSAELQARGIEARPPAPPDVEIAFDAPLLFGLLNAVLDWALDNARSRIDFEVAPKAWPAQARLRCRFAHRPADRLDSIHWRLVQQTAWAVGLPLERTVDAAGTALAIDFPRVAGDALRGMSAVELGAAGAQAFDAIPLAGSRVLVIAQRREVHMEMRDALRHLGLVVDCVASVAEAADFCRDATPQAVVIESPLLGERYARLRRELARTSPAIAFIELVEDSQVFEMAAVGSDATARVGRDAAAQALPAALLFELSKGA